MPTAPIAAIVSTVASVGGGIYRGIAAKEAADKQAQAMRDQANQQDIAAQESELLAYQNAANSDAELYETLRREEREAQVSEGERRAKAAASGVTLEESTSTGALLKEAGTESAKQIEWLKTAGLSKSEIIRWQGRMTRARGVSEANHMRSLAKVEKSKGSQKLVGNLFTSAGSAGKGGIDAWSKWK